MTTAELTDFEALKGILGYSDERSVLKWCKLNKISVVKLGFKKYISSHSLTQYIDNQLVIFEVTKPELKIVHNNRKKKDHEQGNIYNEYLAKFDSIKKTKAA